MSRKTFTLSRLYPGNIWFKRIGYLLLVYGIGLNFFIGNVQDKVIIKIQEKTKEISANNDEVIDHNFPDLSSIEIQRGSNAEYWYNRLRNGLTSLGFKVISVDEYNRIVLASRSINTASEQINSHIFTIDYLVDFFAKIIKITSNLIWISIIWALIWLYFDIRKGNVRRFVKVALAISIPFNMVCFYVLTNYLTDQLNYLGIA